jgi:hypothetical protein
VISDQFIESVVKSVREGGLRLPLDNVVLHGINGESWPLEAPVEIQQGPSDWQCQIRLHASTPVTEGLSKLVLPPRIEPVSVSSDDYLRVEGVTPQAVTVRLDGFSPISANHQSSLAGTATSQTQSFSFHRIHFIPSGTDRMNVDELLDFQHAQKVKDEAVDQLREPRKSEPDEEFFAIIPGVKLKIRPGATLANITHPYHFGRIKTSYNCFYGEVAGGEFCLEDQDGDLGVYFCRPLQGPDGVLPTSAIFKGILRAVGFTHGVHPWPYFQQHKIDHRVEERWVKPPQECATASLPPMCEGRMRQATDSRNLFVKAVEFFAEGSEQAETFDRALWLLHASNPPGMAFEVRVLTLCSVLEGLVKEHAGGNLGSNPEPWRTAIASLHLDWDGWFEQVFQSWKDYRNKLAHGFDVLPSGAHPLDIAHVFSRIFAAIYVIMARQMGYLGLLEASMLENRNAILLTETTASMRFPSPPSSGSKESVESAEGKIS